MHRMTNAGGMNTEKQRTPLKKMLNWLTIFQIQLLNANSAIFQLHVYCIYHCENKLIFNEMMKVHFVLDQHAELDFYSFSSLKQQSADRLIAPLGHIILIPSQPVFALSP